MTVMLRNACVEDAREIEVLLVKAWQTYYSGIVHQSYLNGLDPNQRAIRRRQKLELASNKTLLAFNNAQLAGFITSGPSREEEYEGHYEVHAIYLDPAYIGQGVGKVLFVHAVQHALTQDFSKMFINVMEKNDLGRKFYERMGGTIIENSMFMEQIGDQLYPVIKYQWTDLSRWRSDYNLT